MEIVRQIMQACPSKQGVELHCKRPKLLEKVRKKKRVRVLLDSGSQKSFVTVTSVTEAALKELMKEWLEITTYGQSVKKSGLQSVVSVEIQPVGRGRGVRFEA